LRLRLRLRLRFKDKIIVIIKKERDLFQFYQEVLGLDASQWLFQESIFHLFFKSNSMSDAQRMRKIKKEKKFILSKVTESSKKRPLFKILIYEAEGSLSALQAMINNDCNKDKLLKLIHQENFFVENKNE